EVEGVQMVTFKNDKANRVLDAQYYAESDEIVFPEAPTQVGFDFAGWNMTEAEIKAAIAAGKDVTVLATWTKAVVPVQVTVNGGTGTGTYPANNQVTVVANAPEAGQKFAYWVDGDGNVKSYNAEYSFFPSGDVELTAVFVAEDAEIEYQILVNLDSIDFESQAATNKAVFTYSWYCPEGYTFVKAGLVAVNKDNFNEATFVAGTTDSNVYDRSPNSANNISVNTYTWTKSCVMSGQTWVAGAYVQYRDANGQVQTVYSDIVEATKE
ncbi:MAG: InlB B-repeat-containing protein, partial [Ruminococcus sp.]|nr:InlB B-repeat-containing protein [Ruminococcus sp.]